VVNIESICVWSNAEIAGGNGFVFWQMPVGDNLAFIRGDDEDDEQTSVSCVSHNIGWDRSMRGVRFLAGRTALKTTDHSNELRWG
jgi:hypothetical protein